MAIITFFIVTITGCGNKETAEVQELQTKIETYQEDIKNLEEKHEGDQVKMKRLEEERSQYKDFIDKTIKHLDEEALLEVAKSQWVYQIKVDENPISNDGKVEVNKDSFNIMYSQEQSLLSSIQDEIFNKGQISGDYFEHLKVVGMEPNNINRSDGTVITAFIYEFENLPANTSFTLEISDELKERLNVETNIINIQVNY